jgi:L-asparaginase / beta-aspartyl-peptidase
VLSKLKEKLSNVSVKPFLIGTHNAGAFLHVGVEVLRNGGSAIDAVETATRLVELNTDDTSVGVGGIANLLGVQEMDASVMCGKTLNAGAVGAIKGFIHPISVARKLLDVAPHVLLVGAGAERFACAMGCEAGDTATELSDQVYRAFVNDAFEHEGIDESQAWIVDYARSQDLRAWYETLDDDQHGTVNIQARDANGDLACAVSTSGTALKFPGRLGDSPIIGAGNYCDNRFGAAACTGRGELSLRLGTARTVVQYLESGLDAEAAAARAMRDIHALGSYGGMSCLVMQADGHTASATTNPDRPNIHWYMDVECDAAQQRAGATIPA